MRTLPEKITIKATQQQVDGYLYIVQTLLPNYENDADLFSKLVGVGLVRILVQLQKQKLKFRENINFQITIEQAMCWNIALREFGGLVHGGWAAHHYAKIQMTLDPILS